MKPDKRQDNHGTYGRGKGVYLTNEIRESAAYRILSPTEKLVLFDFIRKHYRVSSGDKNDIQQTGFIFTMQDTLEAIDHKTFYKARARLVAVGFCNSRPDLKRLLPASPDVFTPSTRWRKYLPDTTTAQRIEARQKHKAEYIKRGKDRKRQYIQQRGGITCG